MKTIQWDESLSVDVDEIDEDHRRLVDLYNLLSQSVAQNAAKDYIEALLEELISCTIWHFRHEERLMLYYQYDAQEQHKAEHSDLIDGARALQDKFHDQDKLLNDEDIDYLSHWLTEHILGHDMRLGFYLMKKM